jgi:hypothetical protein
MEIQKEGVEKFLNVRMYRLWFEYEMSFAGLYVQAWFLDDGTIWKILENLCCGIYEKEVSHWGQVLGASCPWTLSVSLSLLPNTMMRSSFCHAFLQP